MIRLHDRLAAFRRDEGLGLVEVVAAMGIIFIALLALAYTATVALNDIGLARQRQGANAIANRVVEQVRALPYEDISQDGMDTNDLSGDPNIVACSGTYCFGSTSGEQIVHTNRSGTIEPLYPHIEQGVTVRGSPTEYTRALYLTEAQNVPSAGAFRVRVVVSWDQNFRIGASDQVEVETLIFDPETQASELAGTAAAPQGGVVITGEILGTSLEAELEDVAARSDADSPGFRASVQGRSVASQVSVTEGGTEDNAGGEFVVSGADVDSTTSVDTYENEDDTGGGGDASSSVLGLGTSLSLSAGADSVHTISATAAGDPNPSPPPSTQECPFGTSLETDSRPCGASRAQQNGDLSADLDVEVQVDVVGIGLVTVDLGSTNLVRVAAPSAPTTAIVDDDEVAGTDGRIDAFVERSIGSVGLLGLPSALEPSDSDWDGYLIRMGPYQDDTRAQAGHSTTAPTVNRSPGAIEYWDGDDYQTHPFGGGSVPLSFTLNGTVNGAEVELGISGDFTSGSTSTSDPDGASLRTRAQAQSTSPILGNFTYDLEVAGVTVTDLHFAVDFGTIASTVSYQQGSP